METKNRKSSGGHFAVALIFFITAAAIAILMLLAALVVWLSQLTGSFIISTLIVGGFFGLLAIIIYMLSIREGVERIRDQLETVYDVAHTAKEGYQWITDKVMLFLGPRDRNRCCDE
ncbi:hypothetical protein [uncultured Alistipes sp.]|jgi:hypothetical protein|uniref:hypothetical protein n=1 Tax=uncultured Alistipes sp. TaxID=538949 RepID=UPI0025F2A425|nr:hypothetical protein [uncultured Alistipes sp.]